MTRKEYKAVAKIISSVKEEHPSPEIIYYSIARDLSQMFAEDNQNFDESRFMSACGIAE